MYRYKVIFENDLHNTTATAFAAARNNGRIKLSKDQAKRVERSLCGISDCCCGPNQWKIYLAVGGNLCWEEMSDGSIGGDR